MSYLEPWQLEGDDALEIEVGAARVAWTESDDVFVLSKETQAQSTREDGFVWIGALEWVGDVEDDEDEPFNLQRLREFVLKWQSKGETK
jgi:hypothetical protein